MSEKMTIEIENVGIGVFRITTETRRHETEVLSADEFLALADQAKETNMDEIKRQLLAQFIKGGK